MSYLRGGDLDETNYPLFAEVKRAFGFVPNFYRAQTERPDLIEAQAQLVNELLIKQSALARQLKEYVFLVCSAANLSTYCVMAHCEIVRILGHRRTRTRTNRCRSRLDESAANGESSPELRLEAKQHSNQNCAKRRRYIAYIRIH